MATTASTTGINTSGLSKVKTALGAYRQAVSKKCDISASTKQVTAAIKGTSSEATLRQMALTIDTKMKQYIAHLGQYDQLLNQMASSYNRNDQTNTSFTSVTKSLQNE